MKIAICGCSLSSPPHNKPPHYDKFLNTHFSELLGTKHNVINFAEPGVSNYHIRLQVEEAIKQKPDVVILTATNTARVELNTNKTLDNNLCIRGIHEIEHSTMVSVHQSMVKNHDLSAGHKTALKYYFDEIYNEEWEKKKQIWIINDALTELQHNKIPCILQPGFLISRVDINNAYTIEETLKHFYNLYGFIIPYEHSLAKISLENKHKWLNNDPGYHTHPEGQYQFYRYLIKKALLKINNTYRTGIIAQ